MGAAADQQQIVHAEPNIILGRTNLWRTNNPERDGRRRIAIAGQGFRLGCVAKVGRALFAW